MSAVDASAIQAATAATSATYRSFADATRSVLDLLERHLPDAVLFLAHLDRAQFIHRIVDARNGGGVGLRSNLATPLGDAFCSHMAEDRAPRLCNAVGRHDVYRDLPMQEQVGASAYLGVPLELSDGTRVGSLAALRHSVDRLHRCRRAAVHDARARARLGARAREQRARPAALQRHAARPGARDGRGRPRRPRPGHAPTTPARPSARPPARSPARPSRSCSSRPAASSCRPPWRASRSRR